MGYNASKKGKCGKEIWLRFVNSINFYFEDFQVSLIHFNNSTIMYANVYLKEKTNIFVFFFGAALASKKRKRRNLVIV